MTDFRAFYDGKTLDDLGTLFGPATCGCVALVHDMVRGTLTFDQMARRGPQRGWARCPHCHGTGVDVRAVQLVEVA